jgi:predicted ATPase
MERAIAAGYRFELTDDDVPVVSRICRRLDGLALTIELAAGWTAKFGIKGTAELLDRRYGLLLKGRRVAHPRHQTIDALLDWSYNLLTEFEQKVLCRLAVFVGIFCLEAAQAVAAGPGDDRDDIIAAIGHLVAKSLVSAAESGAACFRLLETTRTYGFTKLVDSGEMNQVAQRHAKYCREFLQRPNEALYCHEETPRSFERLKHLGNIRATLE